MVVQECEKLGAVLVAEEDRLAIVAALREVERVFGRRESRFAGHSIYKWISRGIFLINFAKKMGGGDGGQVALPALAGYMLSLDSSTT